LLFYNNNFECRAERKTKLKVMERNSSYLLYNSYASQLLQSKQWRISWSQWPTTSRRKRYKCNNQPSNA